ncbi:MAG: PAS domain-containing protein [Chromatiales bacterium]|nr:PAS domain-containing protein [Chromatiales bacterium]
MQDAIRQSEQAFRSLAENSPDFIIRYDLEDRIRYLNANLIRMLGIGGAEEFLGQRPREAWPDGRYAPIEAASARARASGEPQRLELLVPAGAGKVEYHHLLVVPERDAAGTIVGTLMFGRDITEVRETEQRLRHFIDSIPGIAFTFRRDADGKFSFPYVSHAIREIYGLEPEDVRTDFSALHDLAHPDDRPVIEATIAESARTMTPYRLESRVCRPGMPERWLDTRAVPERQPDGSLLWYGLMLDVTDRKRAEETLRKRERELHHLAENSPDNIISYDDEGRVRYLNSKLERELGKTLAELEGRKIGELFPDGRFAEIETTMLRAIRQGEVGPVVLPVAIDGQDIRHHQIRAIPERDETGRIIGALRPRLSPHLRQPGPPLFLRAGGGQVAGHDADRVSRRRMGATL